MITVLALSLTLCPVAGGTGEASDSSGDASSLKKRLEGSDPLAAIQAAEEIRDRGKAEEALVRALAGAIKHPNEMVRLSVVGALSEIGADAAPAVPALTEALEDKDPLVREAAALALFSVGDQSKPAIPGLIACLGDRSRPVRDAAILAVVKIGKASVACKEDGFKRGDEVIAVIRPEDVIPHSAGAKRSRASSSKGANLIDVKIDSMEFLGSYWRAHLGGTTLGGVPMIANFSMNAVRRLGLEEGIDMTVELPVERVLVFAKAG